MVVVVVVEEVGEGIAGSNDGFYVFHCIFSEEKRLEAEGVEL